MYLSWKGGEAMNVWDLILWMLKALPEIAKLVKLLIARTEKKNKRRPK